MVTYSTRREIGKRIPAIMMGLLLLGFAAALLAGLDLLLIHAFSQAMMAL